jgi:glycosyltransferase involved in cell wall biosynthesis
MVLLIGNYLLDRQHSMQRFGMMMLSGLTKSGVAVQFLVPRAILGKFGGGRGSIAKWLAYIDKYVLFRWQLKRELARRPSLVHICDHSNAVYRNQISSVPVLVTCHDLLAVRDALGEETHCPMSFTGKLLQRWILSALRRVTMLACTSKATMADAVRLVSPTGNSPRLERVPLGLNYPFHVIPQADAWRQLESATPLRLGMRFVLHVGSNLPRKNRDGVLRIFAATKNQSDAHLVFAGEPLNQQMLSLAAELGVSERIVQIDNPTCEVLEALYNCALALLYPSTFEGFGWPVIEAQACGCPVVCTDTEALREAAGEAGLFHLPNDENGFAADLLRLADPQTRLVWSEKGLKNAELFSAEKMIARYIDIYRQLGAAA